MYLFTRLATLRGNTRKAMTWAANINGYVDAHSDHRLMLWRADFGYPVGTVTWSAWVESHAAMNAGFASLAEDDGYFKLLEDGQEFLTARRPRISFARHSTVARQAMLRRLAR